MTTIEVSCAIILHEKQVLVAQRSEKMILPLKWEFPGGKINPNETAHDCVIRELKEELNIEIKIVDHLSKTNYDYGTYMVSLYPFIAEYIGGKIKLTEHKDIKWCTKSDLLSLDWAPADVSILNELIKLSYI